MNYKTRKRIWLVSFAAALGVVAMLALLTATVLIPGIAQAQTPPPDPLALGMPMAVSATVNSDTQITLSWTAASGRGITGYMVQRKSGTGAFAAVSPAHTGTDTMYVDMDLAASTSYTYQVRAMRSAEEGLWSADASAMTTAAGTTVPPVTTPSGAMLKSSSSTGSAGVKLTLTIELDENLTGSSWVEIYLEDDYQEPGSIAKEDVVFEVQGTNPADTDPPSNPTLNTTFAAADVEIDDGGDLNDEDNAVVISARIPDMRSGDETGYPLAGQTLLMVVSKAAGIKNPSEAGNHDNGFSILGGTDDRAGAAGTEDIGAGDNADADGKLLTKAKISLSADDGGRGKEVTITGSGFNNGTTATVYVLTMANGATSGMSCQSLLDNGDKVSLGTAEVGSDDKFSVAFTVSNDDFDKGEVNYICARDDEAPKNRPASAVKTFDMTPSLSVSPDSANSGEEVTLKPRDFDGGVITVSLDGTETATFDGSKDSPAGGDFTLMKEGSDYTFDMPGGLSGTVQVSFNQGDVTKRTTIAVVPSSLTLNQTEVAPNQSIIVSGSGFNDRDEILTSNIQIDGKMLKVDDAGTEGSGPSQRVSITSSGQFTVTVNVWHDGAGNPALDADEYTIKVTDESGYEGKTKITILEPTVMVTPQVAGPRDFITISGTNWPVSTSEDDYDVSIEVDDKTRTASIDSSGRFNYEYRLSGGIGIGEEHDVKVTFTSRHNDKIEEETTFSVPSSNVVITPAAAVPGQTIDLEISGMPIGELVSKVTIDGGNRLGGINLNTDRNGDVTITGIVVPYSEPGFYPVKIEVGTGSSPQIAIVQLEILAEGPAAGVTAALPGAVEDLGDSVVRIFHFNTSTKVWTFYDPRPEFDGLNTLTELAAGQPYWVLVSEDVENVVLNGRTRNLTCVGGDCWNQLVW